MNGPHLIIISWRDIPAQVTARHGRKRASIELHPRFQRAIDRAAVLAGKHTADDYVAEWRRQATQCGADLAAEVERAAGRLDAEFTPPVLGRYVTNGGHRPEGSPQIEGAHR
jgi:hypothetical protein